ncbi:TetR/AcrR family transcriptional regulator [Varibaculum sp.]|uniref:TetR/AcrR family transcriptional regulator n=1 Tax=Varibaculum sp. TaxID=1895474 RepID=UPI0025E96BC9|nr:TetR/AcrR family transcriptional regulator [Varibaculum sp.]
MSGIERREQLIGVARSIFAEKGFEATSMEEISAKAKVSKPVVYEHFGGKEGLYAVIVDREVQQLVSAIIGVLEQSQSPRAMAEGAALALLDYIDTHTDGFRILVRDSPASQSRGSYYSVIGDVAQKVEALLAEHFRDSGFHADWAPMYAHMMVGLVSQVGQWWLDERKPSKQEVAAHIVNLVWYDLSGMRKDPHLVTDSAKKLAS